MSNTNSSLLLIPLALILGFLGYFIISTINAPSSEKDIKQAIEKDYTEHIHVFNETITYLKSTETVWNRFEIYFHPKLGTRFQAFDNLDTLKIDRKAYQKKYADTNNINAFANYYPDFSLNETIFNKLRAIGIAKINYTRDSSGISFEFMYKYRTFRPADIDYYIAYSKLTAQNPLDMNSILWYESINDTIFCYAKRSF